MAEDYTQFSCVLDVKSAKNVKRAMEIYDNPPGWPRDEYPLQSGFSITALEDECDSEIWLHADPTGDPELLIAFVILCAKEFDLTGLWGFEYANICSKPRLEAFGGGAYIIDLGARKVAGSISTFEWLRSSLARSAS